MTPLRSFVLLLSVITLAACNNSGPKNDKRSATGEVLQGTTSDAMIPLGQLTSQPPLLPPTSKGPATPEQAADRDNGSTSAIDLSSAAPDQAVPPAPTTTPTAPSSATP